MARQTAHDRAPWPMEGLALAGAGRRWADRLAWCEQPLGLFMVALVFALLLFCRKPGVLLHAEVWGDDGWSWYPDAYSIGWHSLLLPVGGPVCPAISMAIPVSPCRREAGQFGACPGRPAALPGARFQRGLKSPKLFRSLSSAQV